ncbi:MAG: acyl-ACP--UDP-N-acetylglucosamine O-acyltransferase [Muribaculaceae bacterium]|nr:acyl-ACP--UDP-N-acetylglucosamine O-acyltransferase [Bacteroidales bacterium]MDY2732912.1 acyl-ACP--UDP-N-acetylglucosamine O-acyltransferase [Muribaculaceae bacterium]MDY5388639.1 acyl-ACP--UDP-N-acetylglucosamine O-acyltransferase [Muribaculaceae bacterium]
MLSISPLAFVHPEAKIGDNVTISAFAYIDRDVEIGDGCVIHAHVSILAGSRIGKNNKFYQGCIIAATPQDFRWKGEESYVVIGDNNTIREHVIINRSIYKDGKTVIGNNSFVMAQSHVAHDSVIGDSVVIGNSVKIAGSVKIGDYSILSSTALVHEKCEIGKWCLIKGGCRVNNNVPPFVIMAHNPISYFGVNAFILRKGNFSDELIDEIAKCYRHIYQSGTSPFNAMVRVKADVTPSPERDAIIEFVEGHNFRLAALHHERDEF